MDGVHDVGGMDGFGPVVREVDELRFHEPWQATALRLMAGGQVVLRATNADEYGHAIERMEPTHYLGVHYHERVFTGATTLLVETGLLDAGDLAARAGGRFPLARPVADEETRSWTARSTAESRTWARSKSHLRRVSL